LKYSFKIGRNTGFLVLAVIIFCTACQPKLSQMPQNQYGLSVIQQKKYYRVAVKQDSNQLMVNLLNAIPNIVLDQRYASLNNFTQQLLYVGEIKALLRLPAAKALQKVQAELQTMGLGLKIFDAYRPYNATEKMWELVKDDRYTADPKKGSGHNRGAAVDLTIIHLATGKELPMPTGFDNFSDTAHHDFMQLPAEVIANRNLLKTTMEKYGFVALPTEWWHYSLPNARDRFMLMDLDFDQF
jgi:zinc D-Ala-D-Ala dipeptidase